MNSNQNINTKNWFLFIISIVLIIGITLIYSELHKQNMIEKSKFVYTIIKDFENNSIVGKKFTAFIMYNLNKREIMLLNKDNKWIPAEPEDQRDPDLPSDLLHSVARQSSSGFAHLAEDLQPR